MFRQTACGVTGGLCCAHICRSGMRAGCHKPSKSCRSMSKSATGFLHHCRAADRPAARDEGTFVPETLLTGIGLGESPRWHADRLWFADWGAREIVTVDVQGNRERVCGVTSFPFSIDWLPDGRLLVVSSSTRQLLVKEPGGSLVPHAELGGLSQKPWNEIVVDGRGNAYINNIGFDFPGGEVTTGIIALVSADGGVRQVA